MTRFSSLPLNAAEPQRTLGCSGREFVDDLDDAENLDILPMTNYGRSGYHRLLAGASGDTHAHCHLLRAARPRALPAPAPLTLPNCARRSDGPSLADSVDSAWETIDPVSPSEALPNR